MEMIASHNRQYPMPVPLTLPGAERLMISDVVCTACNTWLIFFILQCICLWLKNWFRAGTHMWRKNIHKRIHACANNILFNTNASSESIHSKFCKTSIFLALSRLQLVFTFILYYIHMLTLLSKAASQHKCLQASEMQCICCIDKTLQIWMHAQYSLTSIYNESCANKPYCKWFFSEWLLQRLLDYWFYGNNLNYNDFCW